MATKKKVTEVESKVEKKVEVKSRATTRKELAKKIDKNSEILVMNNCRGGFIYHCPKTHEVIDLGERGDTQVITVETLIHMKNTAKRILEKYWLLVIDVLDEEFTVEELFKYTGLEKYGEYMLDMDGTLDNILTMNYGQFQEVIQSLDKNLLSRLVEYAVELYADEKFSDHNKMTILEKAVGRSGIFENIDIAKESI